MQLTDAFDVAAPADVLWPLLNDVERIAPFVPGFVLEDVDGETYRGTIKVRLGAITASYNAEIDVLERDEAARRVVFELAGRERRGPGTVKANVTSQLVPNGDATRLDLVTDVHVTGRVAQLGMGAMADVSRKLIGQFVKSIEQHLAAEPAGDGAATRAAPGGAGAARPDAPPPAAEAVDLGAVAGDAMKERLLPVAGLLFAAAFGYVIGALREARRR
jgi:carbon monoxide dehydrogenase subunit G